MVPARNERHTLPLLVEQIRRALSGAGQSESSEIILVDDGSADGSWAVMQDLAGKHPDQVRALRLRQALGKSVALEAGFRTAEGDIIFTMDADLQDDASEIPRFLKAIEGGFDMVCGWRRERPDPPSKTVPSKVFNRVCAWLTGIPLHDFNCGYKAFRREVIERIRLYGEQHRFFPVFAHSEGFRIGEIEVRHHPRRHGASKFGLERHLRVTVGLPE